MATVRSPLLEGRDADVPPAPFTSALQVSTCPSGGGDTVIELPQTIAHRGYRAAYPENTLAAFRAAIAVGSHALETDLHLSRDGVVVLSHDATLQRCFGRKERIADCDWDFLRTLRTLRAPHEPMPRLVDLLQDLARPELQHVWLLLDIKRDDDPDELIDSLAAAFASVPSAKPWNQRILLGCWNTTYVDVCRELLPGFPIAYIGWSLLYARKLLRVPNVHFNINYNVLVGPCGSRFVAAARAARRHVFVWTVNDEAWMEWSIRKTFDGVITDDPKLFLDVCERWGSGGGEVIGGRDKEASGSDESEGEEKGAERPPVLGVASVPRLPSDWVLPAPQPLLRVPPRGPIRRLARVALWNLLASVLTPLLFYYSGAMARKRRAKARPHRTP
ncbi:hypothetical protein VTK73DRAFT_7547 [Phialemonium thermophilum]|uniref:GP-PDE domain-containing protein n=1 Tax=Phialemonium thermophilum TaxID=223376 RepID=A0ABR3XSW6_9PEZI